MKLHYKIKKNQIVQIVALVHLFKVKINLKKKLKVRAKNHLVKVLNPSHQKASKKRKKLEVSQILVVNKVYHQKINN